MDNSEKRFPGVTPVLALSGTQSDELPADGTMVDAENEPRAMKRMSVNVTRVPPSVDSKVKYGNRDQTRRPRTLGSDRAVVTSGRSLFLGIRSPLSSRRDGQENVPRS